MPPQDERRAVRPGAGCGTRQKIRNTERGVELTMEVAGTTELKTWILGWGDQVEVLEPETHVRTGRVIGGIDILDRTGAMAMRYIPSADV